MQEHKPFGLWTSPISPRSLAGALRLDDVQWSDDGRWLVWIERRGGQSVAVCLDTSGSDAPYDLTPGDLGVRARVGYGGGDFCAGHGMLFFAEASSGRLFRQPLAGGPPHPITPPFGSAAAPALSPDGRWVLYVHSINDDDCLAIVDAEGRQWPQILVGGHDFYMQPCWHPDGTRVAYIAWDHPNMPWDGSTLYMASLNRGGTIPRVQQVIALAGDTETAIFQPAFSPDGSRLAYVSDASGWGQIYAYDLERNEHQQISAGAVDHGQPAWVQGMRSFGWSRDGSQIYCLRNEGGVRQVHVQSLNGGPSQLFSDGNGYTWFDQPSVSPANDTLALIASGSTSPPRIVISSAQNTRVLRHSAPALVRAEQLAIAQQVSWTTAGGSEVYGMLYLPPGYHPGGAGPRPPAILRIHGGPTDQAVAGYRGDVQFFATRGYVMLDVNYRGSTGYGREYMQALREQWGVVDVEDAISAAHYLDEAAIADPARLVIYGGSAGGYTVLESLCRAPGLFRAGVCMYGVANLFALVAETHKFEAHYLDSMIGPLPQTAELYRARSPLFHADQIRDPIAIYQGADDKVVTPDQSESIVAALRRQGVPHIYQLYPDEGHGWRKPETIASFYTSVEAFLQQYVIFA